MEVLCQEISANKYAHPCVQPGSTALMLKYIHRVLSLLVRFHFMCTERAQTINFPRCRLLVTRFSLNLFNMKSKQTMLFTTSHCSKYNMGWYVSMVIKIDKPHGDLSYRSL